MNKNKMNNIEMIINHLEFNGYEIEKSNSSEDSFLGFNKTHGTLFLRSIGESGIRLEKYYPINLEDCQNNKKLSLFKMINEMNRKLMLGTVFLYEDKGMTMTLGLLGNYNKKTFSIALDSFHMDANSMYDFDLKTYWENK